MEVDNDRPKTKYQEIGPRKSLSDEIFEQIKSLIFKGELKPGEKLPVEREFAKILHVGRPCLREALNQLTAVGLIEKREKSGYFVRSVTDELIGPLKVYLEYEIHNLIEFMKVRRMLDTMTAKEAIKKGNKKDFKAISENIGNGYKFHVSIAEATHKLIFIHVISNMHRILSTLSYIKHRKHGGAINEFEQHKRIYEAIIHRNAHDVERAIEDHVESLIKEAKETYKTINKEGGTS